MLLLGIDIGGWAGRCWGFIGIYRVGGLGVGEGRLGIFRLRFFFYSGWLLSSFLFWVYFVVSVDSIFFLGCWEKSGYF